jgi:hypothetical protein
MAQRPRTIADLRKRSNWATRWKTVNLSVDVRPLRRSEVRAAMLVQRGWILNKGSFAWVLSNPRRLAPRAKVGKLGLFDLPDDVIVPA